MKPEQSDAGLPRSPIKRRTLVAFTTCYHVRSSDDGGENPRLNSVGDSPQTHQPYSAVGMEVRMAAYKVCSFPVLFSVSGFSRYSAGSLALILGFSLGLHGSLTSPSGHLESHARSQLWSTEQWRFRDLTRLGWAFF